MTKDQEDKFELYGCASRCLIALANANGANLTKADFIDRYTPRYWAQDTRCGIFSLAGVAEVAVDLGLASSVTESNNFNEVRKHIRNKSIRGLLLVTEKRYEEDGTLSVYHHCTIVSPAALQGDDFLYLTELDYTSGHANGLFLPESAIAPLIPTFLLLHP